MKNTTIFSIMFALVAGISSTAFASTTNPGSNVQVRVVSLKENKILVASESASAEAVLVELLDANKSTLHSRKIRRNFSFAQSYNLSKLTDGNYFIRVFNSSYSYTVPVEINGGVATIRQQEVQEIQRPTVRLADNKLNVYALLVGNPAVSLQMLNDEQKVVYTEETKVNENILNRRYDLSQLPEGVYDVLININGKVFTEEVTIAR
ncbi:hypothetical protein [Telluribacter sp. SYSU D00476]|uniref:hypothetical protein n=1 Tax=Telluribacter sp. SYSU D00476 TaxID=2811430 RepID=UPI001FF5A9D3|nr:hypothetical protein [Telluribacter sp. SYSU D00476]